MMSCSSTSFKRCVFAGRSFLVLLVFGWTFALSSKSSAVEVEKPTVVRTVQSGPWSSGKTWESGKVPATGSRVLIRTGHSVVYDVASDEVIRGITISGTLTFAHDKDTRLNVGLIKIEATGEYSEEGFDCDSHLEEHVPEHEPGHIHDHGHGLAVARASLIVGSPEEPITAEHSAMIRLHYLEGFDKQSCPAIVCCGGRMDFHGAPLSHSWVKIGATAKKGDTTLTLGEAVRGWRVGDRIIITATSSDRGTDGTRRSGKRSETVQTEERTIQQIDGAAITVDQPLAYKHLGEGDFRGEVANLSRNVVVESAAPDGVRGHTMYHRGSAGAISFAEFRHLGKEGVLGRYSLHFHLVGNTMRGSYVTGASIWDSHNRWLTIHGTNDLVVRDNVGYQSVGHGFYLEDGTEVQNVLDRNLAVQAYIGKRLPKQLLPFDANEGAGFWWANSRNTFTRNVSCENDRYGFRFEATPSSSFDIKSLLVMQADGTTSKTDVRTLPFVRFEDNEAHCDGKYGINLGEGVNRVGPDAQHPFVMRNTKIWEVHYAFRPQSPCLLVENMHIQDCEYGVYHPNYDRHVYRNLKIYRTDTEPFNRGHDDDTIQYGPLTVDGLEFTSKYYGGNMPFIQISDNNPTGLAVSHFKNVKVLERPAKGQKAVVNLGGGPRPTPTTEHSVAYYFHDWYGPGRHAKVVSTKAKDLLKDGNTYRSDPPLTGDESRVAEVRDVEFPTVLSPTDDSPPTTVITSVSKSTTVGKLLVRGTTADDGAVKRVLVNGHEATAITPNFGEWSIEIAQSSETSKESHAFTISAQAEDAAGNVEKMPHVVEWK